MENICIVKPAQRRMSLRRSGFLFATSALFMIASAPAAADEYAVRSANQELLLADLLPAGGPLIIDPKIDALLFDGRNIGFGGFIFRFDSTRGDQWDFEREAFEYNRAFQTVTIRNASTQDVFTFGALGEVAASVIETKEVRVGVKSLILDNTTLRFRSFCEPPYQFGPCPPLNSNGYVKEFYIGGTSDGLLRFNNGHLDLEGTGQATTIIFANNSLIDVIGTDNVINAPGQRIQQSAPSYKLEMRLNAGSRLDLINTTNITARNRGFLTMLQGSTLNIDESRLQLTNNATESDVQTNIISSTVNITGINATEPASLHLTDPFISNSTINLGQNTKFYAYRTDRAFFSGSAFYFGGDNTITLGLGAQLLSLAQSGDTQLVSFNVDNGTTVINGSGGGATRIRTNDLRLNNATLSVNGVDIAYDLTTARLRNNSTWIWGAGNADLENVQGLFVDNSTLSGDFRFSESAILLGSFRDATLRIDRPDQPSGMTFLLNGFDGGPKSQISFEGANRIISRIAPQGVDLGFGISVYSDAFIFARTREFTDDNFTVSGLGNVTVELNPFSAGRTAQEYAAGGQNGDGTYDVIFLSTNAGLSNSTTDQDTVKVALGPDMPALLTVTQVATPSADGRVSYRLSYTPQTLVSNSLLTGNPNAQSVVSALVAPTNGQGTLVGGQTVSSALGAVTNSGLSAFVQPLNFVHAEPYSSFLTVGLERMHLLAGGVMDHAANAGEFSGIAPARDGKARKGRAWASVSIVDGDVAGRNNLGSFNYELGQILAGLDVAGDADGALGLYASKGWSSLGEHDRIDQKLDSDDMGFGLYGHKTMASGLQLTGMAGASFGSVDSERRMPATIGGFTGGIAQSHFNTRSFFAGARGHMPVDLGKDSGWTLFPSLSLTYVHTRSGRIEESGGGDFSYRVDPATAESLIVSPGLDIAKTFTIGGLPAAIGVSGRYEYDPLADSNAAHEIKVSTPAFGSLTQVGQNRGPHTIIAGTDATFTLADNVRLGISYEYSNHSHGDEHGVGGNITVTW